jgi:hypothetical protein
MLNRRVLGGFIVVATVLVAGLPATATDIPLRNWSAPATWSSQASSGGGRTALALVPGPPVPLIPVAPCRVMDTRVGFGQTGNFGPPTLGAGATRTISIPTHPTCTGVPTSVGAYSLNLTVTNTGSGAWGYLQVWPTGQAQPTTSNLNYPGVGATLANAAVVQAGTSGQINVFSGAASADVIIDINGYYTGNVGASPFVISSTGGYGIVGISSTNVGVWGMGPTAGVFGQDVGSAGNGVYGLSTGGLGVYGLSSTNSGVKGKTYSTAADTAGVFGTDGAGAGGTTPGFFSAGVRGEGRNGVIGMTNTTGGEGVIGRAISPATVGVRVDGNFTASGTKAFIEPHPSDPSLIIRYVALEGPEAGTYFRGTAKTVDQEAVIQVPDSFRIVSAEEGLTVQLTPVGELAQIAVMSQDLNQIVVRSSRDVTFHYHVNGIRRAFKDWQVVTEGHEFQPVSPDKKMPGWLTEEAKSRLIANGTYNPDGTVNMNTAERLGWAKAWREEAAAAAAARK